MRALRALQKRVVKLEQLGKPRPSPFVIWYGSIDVFVDRVVLPLIQSGAVDRRDMVDVIFALRRLEANGHYAAWGD